MAIAETVDLQAFNIWRQGDVRDPLGIWAARHIIVGDASTGSVKTTIQVPANNRAAHVYFCYDASFGQLNGTIVEVDTKVRLLTNWPDASPGVVGLQGYASNIIVSTQGDQDFTAP